MKIGIIGNGFVGGAIANGFRKFHYDVRIYDIDKERRTHSFENVIEECDFVFVCVPTPDSEKGCDVSIVKDVVKRISEHKSRKEKQTVILKSTIAPGTTRKLSNKYDVGLVFNPEFLTAARAKEDFLNTTNIVIGADTWADGARLESLYRDSNMFNDASYTITDTKTAEFVKYMLNCYFATKVSFLNELKMIADNFGVDWKKATQAFVSDERVGPTHNQVPGPDGKLGFGGACFPKDLNAMLSFASKEVATHMLSATRKVNKIVRED